MINKKMDEVTSPKPLLINIFRSSNKKNDYIHFKAFGLFKILKGTIHNFQLQNLNIKIKDKKYKVNFKFKKGIPLIKGFSFNIYSFEIPLKDLSNMDIQNKIIVNYEDRYEGRIIYNIFDLKKGRCRNSKVFINNNTTTFFRQTKHNTMYLTVRETNKYDYKKNQIKVNMAFFCSKFYPKFDIKLLYEKESSRYEESASVLYEKLIDQGYHNCYYILNKDNSVLKKMPLKYKKNIIYKDTFKHLIYFFKCKKFIGTETIGHSIQLRIANKFAVRKINSPKNIYVFLQHGVMYMISLSSDLRTDFRESIYKVHKTVVSSKLEAQHFIELGGFTKENLYVTGLAKFDRSILSEDADKIVIMPTWRRWESNLAREDFAKTKYYKMIERIVSVIPKDLKTKIIVLPHPLMINAMKNSNCKLKKYLPENIVYDDILKKCKLLITDYSSISYDAFYRGSNIIFYWEEKDECLKEYGEETTLMLTEELAFGEVCYNKEELQKVINNSYNNKQNNKFKNNFAKIVEFKDGENTNRIIKHLRKDKII